MSLDPDAPAGAESPARRSRRRVHQAAAMAPREPEPPAEPPSRSGWLLEFIERYALVVLFVLTLVFFSVWSKTSTTFPTCANIKNVLSSQAVIGILAMAIIIPLTCGEFDFSVGSIAGLTQVLCAGFMTRLGWPVAPGHPRAHRHRRLRRAEQRQHRGPHRGELADRDPGRVDRAGRHRGVVHGRPVDPHLDISSDAGQAGVGRLAGHPAHRLLPRRRGPRRLLPARAHALRSLPAEHRLEPRRRPPGRPAGRDLLVLLAFVISGALAGFAGILWVGSNGGASPQLGTVADTLQALAAAYLGATAIKPGRFNVVGTIVAIFFLAFTVTGLSLAGVQNWINDVFNGAALFVAVLISTIIGRKRAGVT